MNSINTPALYASVIDFLASCEKDVALIAAERKELLASLATHIQQQLAAHSTISLTFICTHNSRRSHFAQIWAQVAAAYYGLNDIVCYSGGTEVTAFNPNAVKALQTAGLMIAIPEEKDNPHYWVKYSDRYAAIEAFSKKYADAPNPPSNYTAVLTCSEADEACPVVFGANARFKITFEDPKNSDGTPEQDAVYLTRCKQIATEMLYTFKLVVH
jgi:protein-tyrosine-phosphatase